MTRIEFTPNRAQVLAAAGLIVIGSAGIQFSSALSSTLFSSYGTIGVSALRSSIAALILLCAIRPRLRGRSRTEWASIAVYGAAMSLMNISLYAAIQRLPLGVAVTLEFLGPCAVALLASRKVKEGLIALVSLGGVVLISVGPAGYFDLLGYLAGVFAAVCFGLYTLFAVKVGKAGSGLDGLALAVTASAILTLPFTVARIGGVALTHWPLLVVAAFIGVVIPYSVDTLAARLTSARIIGTLFAIDPAMGALVGFLVLGEAITFTALLGIVVVMLAGVLLIGGAARGTQPSEVGVTAQPPLE